MMRGTIKTLKKTEGYGFISDPVTGDDYFFHRSHVGVDFDSLERDQEVEFTPTEGPKGPRAINIVVLDSEG